MSLRWTIIYDSRLKSIQIEGIRSVVRIHDGCWCHAVHVEGMRDATSVIFHRSRARVSIDADGDQTALIGKVFRTISSYFTETVAFRRRRDISIHSYAVYFAGDQRKARIIRCARGENFKLDSSTMYTSVYICVKASEC